MEKKKSIYKQPNGKKEILKLYDKQLERLSIPFKDRYVSTSFGNTHIIETGNIKGVPLLVFHGGNATTAYNLLSCDFLFKDFHIYAVDIIGHPGKSDETVLSANNYDYGKWISEIISNLGYDSILCFGGSFGAGVIVKAMCVAPKKIKKAVLYVPSGINNALGIKNIKMMFPMIMYWITHKEKWFKKSLLPMALTEENITNDTYETAKCSIDFSKIKASMPSNAKGSDLKECNAPTLVMAGEKDCLFPAKKVISSAEKIIPNCKTYLLKNRGHMSNLTNEEKNMIVDFLKVDITEEN